MVRNWFENQAEDRIYRENIFNSGKKIAYIYTFLKNCISKRISYVWKQIIIFQLRQNKNPEILSTK